MKLHLSPSTEPVAAEPSEMALLSSLLAAYSYISGGCWCLLARTVTWGPVLAFLPVAGSDLILGGQWSSQGGLAPLGLR